LVGSELNRRFADAYGPKYEWDMEGFDEPVYAVRAAVVFGLRVLPASSPARRPGGRFGQSVSGFGLWRNNALIWEAARNFQIPKFQIPNFRLQIPNHKSQIQVRISKLKIGK